MAASFLRLGDISIDSKTTGGTVIDSRDFTQQLSRNKDKSVVESTDVCCRVVGPSLASGRSSAFGTEDEPRFPRPNRRHEDFIIGPSPV